MDSICQKFIQIEQDFFLAVQSDEALEDFAERWQALQVEWESSRCEVDTSTRQLVDEIAGKIEELAGDFYLSQSFSLSLEGDLLDGLEDVFSTLTLEDLTAVDTLDATTIAPEGVLPAQAAISPSQWLLRNLHNPYPLPHVRFSTGETAGSKSIKDWFGRARQRIGWTRLLRDRFAGCRSLATDAAFRAFVRDDPTGPLSAELKTAFLAIKSHAELVYGDEEPALPSASKRPRSVSPTPSLTFSSGSEDSDDDHCSIPSPGDDFQLPSEQTCLASPSRKRRRTHESRTTLDSPPRAPVSPARVECPSSHPQKKRRLSESDSDSPRPKRPKGVGGGRVCAVSNPLISPANPAWLNSAQPFQIPDPASIGPFDSSSFDLDFFTPPSLPHPSVSGVFAQILSADHVLTSNFEVPSTIAPIPADFSALFEIPQLDLLQPGQTNFGSDWTELLNFEPDLSLFSYSPSSASSLASTPPLDDAALPPSPDGSPFGTDPLLGILPCPGKDIQFSALNGPIIHGQDFLLPPGEGEGIPSVAALLSVH